MKIYKEGGQPLYELLKEASSAQGATLLVPDLQRPYVWTPNQVTLLVDSILRGWPFGTLLLWDINNEELASIPSRPFWRIADRTEMLDDEHVGRSNPPARFRMVLDGQQRLQSLLLAFGGDRWGFRLLDRDWSAELESERPRGRNARQHWSLGHLCLDLRRFREHLGGDGSIEHINFSDVLAWVVLDPTAGQSAGKSAKYKAPLERADGDNLGRFIHLSRLWDLAPVQTRPSERQFRASLEPELHNHSVPQDLIDATLQPLAELMSKIVDAKQSSVSFLELLPYDIGTGADTDVYNDAIVNIFTRLNTAGRALTRQEITFAWIKNGWGTGEKVGNRSAVQCFEELQDALAEKQVKIGMDGLVGAISTMWSVLYRNGMLLHANDLLRGEKVRPMAQDLVGSWSTIRDNALAGARIVKKLGFEYGTHYRSLNVLTLLLTWRLLGWTWLSKHPLSVTSKDDFEKSLDALFRKSCDRWILMSQWSGRWGKSTDRSLSEYARNLAEDWKAINETDNHQEVIALLENRMGSWIAALTDEASEHIHALNAPTRNRVQDYFLPLWVWHRLDDERWKASSITLRDPKATTRSEVDHVVAVKVWEELAASTVNKNDGTIVSGAADEALALVNELGNCCLLEKAFNISKGAKPLSEFLSRVHEFKTNAANLSEWSSRLWLDPELVTPTGQSIERIGELIKARTARMKEEIQQYLEGKRQLVAYNN